MAVIIQHIPEYFRNDGFEAKVVEFETQDELLDIPFVHAYTITYDETPDEYFHKFSLKDNNLIVESFGGRHWHIVGTIDDVSVLDLPQLDSNYEEDFEKCEGSVSITQRP